MSQSSRCGHCEKLPPLINPHAGSPARCPLCKGDLLIARQSGATYRPATADEIATARRRGRRLTVSASVLVALVGAGIAAAVLTRAPDPVRSGGASVVARLAPPQQEPTPARSEAAVAAPARPAAPTVVRGAARAAPGGPAQAKHGPKVEAAPQAELPAQAAFNQAPWWGQARSEELLRSQLLDTVPELALDEAGPLEPKNAKEVKAVKDRIKQQALEVAELDKRAPDGFVKHQLEWRADLAGLPWRMGKDCQLEKDGALALRKLSLQVRNALSVATKPAKGKGPIATLPLHPDQINVNPDQFWNTFHIKATTATSRKLTVPTLEQMLTVENRAMRLSLVGHLAGLKDDGIDALARRAVYELSPDVRVAAVEALKRRPPAQYTPVLLAGLRHPWPAAAQHAAEALVALGDKDVIPELVRLLDVPDPRAPFERTVAGKPIPMVRELVRVNHLRNCLLCHAPSLSTTDAVRAPIPVPGETLPTGPAYYSERPGVTLVRPDITYLKQDFSVMQPVAHPGSWPVYQRYDYLVRERALTPDEARERAAERQGPSEHRDAVLFALRGLTGHDAGDTTRAWWDWLMTTLPKGAK